MGQPAAGPLYLLVGGEDVPVVVGGWGPVGAVVGVVVAQLGVSGGVLVQGDLGKGNKKCRLGLIPSIMQ